MNPNLTLEWDFCDLNYATHDPLETGLFVNKIKIFL